MKAKAYSGPQTYNYLNLRNRNIGFDFFKFILILGIVSIHSNVFINVKGEFNQAGYYVVEFFSSKLTIICVPSFFILSGYLFFKNLSCFTFNVYWHKLKSRLFSLAMPYFLWNFLGAILTLIKVFYLGFPSYGLISNGSISWIKIVEGFWNFHDGYPFAFAFWFIRNLIIFVAISPLAFLIGGKHKYLILPFLLLLCTFNITLWGFEYFIIGCWFASFKTKLKINIYTASFFISIWIGTAIITIFFNLNDFSTAFKNLMGICAYLGLSFFIEKNLSILRNHFIHFFINSTFYIYAIHQFFCTITRNFYIKIFGLTTFYGIISSYICTFLTLLIISLLIWIAMKKIAPHTTYILGGFR